VTASACVSSTATITEGRALALLLSRRFELRSLTSRRMTAEGIRATSRSWAAAPAAEAAEHGDEFRHV
jgi:hypothetical protein